MLLTVLLAARVTKSALRRGLSRGPHYEARIDRLARRLIADHDQRRWMHAHEHDPSTECVFCDVIRRATALLLERTR
jgi:hypothetical protein